MGAIEPLVTPIFRSVEQALHVSFLMGILPVREKSQMQRMIENAMRECGVWNDSHEEGTVNFAGLSPLEVRAQCAMIVACVHDHLPDHEQAVVWARYSYQAEKAAGVRGVLDYVGPLLSVGHADARLAMGWSVFGTDRQRADFTASAIAREWGLQQKAVVRDVSAIKQTARRLFDSAVDRLGALFGEAGVC